MAYIVRRKNRGHDYFFKVEGYRENGKVKQRVLEYFGTVDPRKNPAAQPITKKTVIADRRFGDVALLYEAARRMKFIDTVDHYMPKRQGLSLGLELFLSAAHRLLDDKPSAANLSRWTQTTHLPQFLGFDADRINDNTQSYLMDKLYDEEHNVNHILRISKDLYANTLPLFGPDDSTFFYDVTSTYFEGSTCPIARLGYSRDGQSDKLQINIGMVMNGAYGIPIMTKVFEGNINDVQTVIEMVYYTKFTFGKEKGLIVMDRGMESEENIRILDGVRYDYVIGLRSNHNFVEEIKDQNEPGSDDWEVLKRKDRNIQLKRFRKNIFGKRRYVILYYDSRMAQIQDQNRQERIRLACEALEKHGGATMKQAQKLVDGIAKYFVLAEVDGAVSWHLNQVAVNQAKRKDGKFCMITNLEKKASEVYGLYFSKDKIEKGFRHMKQDASLHPTRRRLADHVVMDVFICHLAYLLMRVAEHLARQKKIDLFWDGLSSESKEIRLLEFAKNGENRGFQIVSNNQRQKTIVDEMNLYRQIPLSQQKPI